jgi:hypothetical protein
MLDVLIVALVVGTLVALVAYHIPHDTPGFPTLSTEDAKILVKTCTRQALPNPQDPPCLIRQGDEVHGLSILVSGTSTYGDVQGLVIGYSSNGNQQFNDQIQSYITYPRGEHIFPDDPRWQDYLRTFLNGGKLQGSVTP